MENTRTCTKCHKAHTRESNWCWACAYPNKEAAQRRAEKKKAREQAERAAARATDQAALVAGRKAMFLEELVQNGGHVEKACRAAGVSRVQMGRYRDDDPEFATAWENVQEYNVEVLEAEVDRRALGYKKPLTYQGQLTGQYITEYSDTLLMFRLKALRPEKYRDGPGIRQGTGLSEPELDEALTKMMARRARQAKDIAEAIDNELPM